MQLDSRLDLMQEVKLSPELQGLEYDCSDSGEQLCYVDDAGLWLRWNAEEKPICLAPHPVASEGEPPIRLAVRSLCVREPQSLWQKCRRKIPCTTPGTT